MEIKTIFDIVYQINCDIYTSIGKEEYQYLDIISDGYSFVIQFLGNRIWCSEDDERNIEEDTGDYESLDTYLRRKIKRFILDINKIII